MLVILLSSIRCFLGRSIKGKKKILNRSMSVRQNESANICIFPYIQNKGINAHPLYSSGTVPHPPKNPPLVGTIVKGYLCHANLVSPGNGLREIMDP